LADLQAVDPQQGWTDASSGAPTGAWSCADPHFCAGVDSEKLISGIWNGTNWKAVTVAGPPQRTRSLFSMSCTSPSFCMAVGMYFIKTQNWAWAERWNGKKWQFSKTPAIR